MHRWLMVLAAACNGFAQQPGTISTFMGAYPEGLGGPAKNAALQQVGHAAQDAAGNIYIPGVGRIYKVDTDGRLTLFAGNRGGLFGGDGGQAAAALIWCGPQSGIVIDRNGSIVFSDVGNYRIRRISPDGIIRTIAGTGVAGFSGDGGSALAAQIGNAGDLAVDASNNIYFSDSDTWVAISNNRVRRISADGTITTVAGSGLLGYSGDGGPAKQAALSNPRGLAVDTAGNLYIDDQGNRKVRRVSPDGTIRTIAGIGEQDSPQQDLQGNPIDWAPLLGLAIDAADNLYIAASQRIFKRDREGKITIFAGTGKVDLNGGYSGPALGASFSTPWGLFVGPKGNLLMGLVPEYGVAQIDATGNYSTVAGGGPFAGAQGGPAYARVTIPLDVALDSGGTLYVLTVFGLQKVSPSGQVSGWPEPYSPYSSDSLFPYNSIAINKQGEIAISNGANNVVLKATPDGRFVRLAGRETILPSEGSSFGDGGAALDAGLNMPTGVAYDSAGNLYISDTSSHRVRKVTPEGIISTAAGTGTAGFSGDGGQAAAAQLNNPIGVAVDAAGSLYIADFGNRRVRKVTPQGTISTFAGNGQAGPNGDGGPATQAAIPNPVRLTFDSAGSLYMGQSGRIRKVAPNGIISTVAGNGNGGLTGDGGPALKAAMNPLGIVVDANQNIYFANTNIVADTSINRVRKIHGSAPFSLNPSGLVFASTLGGSPQPQAVFVASADGTARSYSVQSSVPWLTFTNATGTVDSRQTARVVVTANPGTMPKGTYSGKLTITDPAAFAAVELPVTLTVSGTSQQLRLSQVGLTFTALQGGSVPPTQTLQVLNTGSGAMAWTAAASTLGSAGTWLSIAPPGGTTTAGATAPIVNVTANPAGLAPGSYYGQVTATAPSADNSPQSAVVLLNVLPSDGTPGPQVDPTGFLFTTPPGANPAAQSIKIANLSTRTVNYTAARTPNTANWLTAPAAGSLTAGQQNTVNIQPNSTALAAGVYRATITFTFQPDNVTRTVDVALVVSAGLSPQAPRENGAAATCVPKVLVAVIRKPGAGYQTAAGWPVPIESAIVDDCGAPLQQGGAVATFSTNDPSIVLQRTGDGIWQGTWASRTTQAATNVTITLRAQNVDQSLVGTTTVQIRSNLNPDQPSIAPGGVVNAASFKGDTPLSPGEYISVFGSKLAKEFQAASSLPLPATLGDTVVAIAGKTAPLHFASDGQVNAILPYGIADNTSLQMYVRRGNVISLPQTVLTGSTQPAVFTVDGSGSGQAIVYAYTPEGFPVIADKEYPSKPGDSVLMYATGLGPVNPPVTEGQPAPSSPLSLPVNPITVTIQAKKAEILFAGLAPGLAGIYQINVKIPADVTSDPGSPLIVTAGQQSSPVVTIAVARQ